MDQNIKNNNIGGYTQALIPVPGVPGANYSDGSRQNIWYQGKLIPTIDFFGKNNPPQRQRSNPISDFTSAFNDPNTQIVTPTPTPFTEAFNNPNIQIPIQQPVQQQDSAFNEALRSVGEFRNKKYDEFRY